MLSDAVVGPKKKATLLGKESQDSQSTSYMPSSTASKWFITVSTEVWEKIDLEMVIKQSTCYAEYYVIKEYGSEGNHPHIHAFLQGVKDEKQEIVRRRWMKVLVDIPSEHVKHALKVMPCTDKDRLLGQYFTKEIGVEVLISNIPTSKIDTLREAYKNVNSQKQKLSKWKQPALSQMPDEMTKFSQVHDLPLTTHSEFKDVLRHMMRNGYNLVNILGRMKYVWSQLAAMQNVYDEMNYLD